MTTRRIVSLIVGATIAALAGAIFWAVTDDGSRRAAALTTSYPTGRFVLLSGEKQLGVLKSATCPGVGAEAARVAEDKSGRPDPRQIGAVTYDDCVLKFGLGMSQELYAWINDAMAAKGVPKDLTVQVLDGTNKELQRLELPQAALKEFAFPVFDASTDAYGDFTLTVASAAFSVKKGSGATVELATTTSKNWLTSTFRFEMGGGTQVGVVKVGSLAFEVQPGSPRPLFREFKLTVGSNDYAYFEKMRDTFVIGGQNSSAYEPKARLVSLDSTLKDAVATFDLSGVGMTAGSLLPDSDGKRDYTLYPEAVTLSVAP